MLESVDKSISKEKFEMLLWEKFPLLGCGTNIFHQHVKWECEEKWEILIWLHKFAIVIKNVSFKSAELKWILSWNSNLTQIAN